MRLEEMQKRINDIRKRVNSIAEDDGECEEWAAIIKVRTAPGWDGKITWGDLIGRVGRDEKPDQIVQMCKVPKGRRLGVTTVD